MTPLTKVETALLMEFLEDLSNRMGNQGCNDYAIKDTPEHRRIVKAASSAEAFQEGDIANGKIMTMDGLLVDYLRERLQGRREPAAFSSEPLPKSHRSWT